MPGNKGTFFHAGAHLARWGVLLRGKAKLTLESSSQCPRLAAVDPGAPGVTLWGLADAPSVSGPFTQLVPHLLHPGPLVYVAHAMPKG